MIGYNSAPLQAAAEMNTTRPTIQSEVKASYNPLKPEVYLIHNSKLFPTSRRTPRFFYGYISFTVTNWLMGNNSRFAAKTE